MAIENRNSDSAELEWIYCIVGNIVEKHEFGESREIRYGTKQFRPCAKVYCLPHLGYGGMGWDDIVVMGKPRKQFRLIQIVIRRKLIHNFRLKKVWDKRVIKEMNVVDPDSNEANKLKLLQFIDYFNNYIF